MRQQVAQRPWSARAGLAALSGGLGSAGAVAEDSSPVGQEEQQKEKPQGQQQIRIGELHGFRHLAMALAAKGGKGATWQGRTSNGSTGPG